METGLSGGPGENPAVKNPITNPVTNPVRGGIVGDVVFYGPAAFAATYIVGHAAGGLAPFLAGSSSGVDDLHEGGAGLLVVVFAIVGALIADLGLPGSLIGVSLGRRGRYFGRWAGRFGYDGRVGHSGVAVLAGTAALCGLVYVDSTVGGPLAAFFVAYVLHLAADQLTGRHPVYWLWPLSSKRTGALAPVLGRRVATGSAVAGKKVEEAVLGWIRPKQRPQRSRNPRSRNPRSKDQRGRKGRRRRAGSPSSSNSAGGARRGQNEQAKQTNQTKQSQPRAGDNPQRALKGGK